MKQTLKDPILMLLLAVAACLIFANLGSIYLWQDEAETAVLAKNTLQFGFPRAFDGKNLVDHQVEYRANYAWVYHPWIHFYLTAGSFLLFGPTTLAARLPFAVFGLVSVWLVYLLAWRLTKDRSVARLTTLLVVFSVPFLLHLRQCRWYALSIFFTLWLVLAYLDFAEQRKLSSFKFVLVSLLFFYSDHGRFIAVFAGLALHYLIFYRQSKQIKRVFPVALILAIFSLPWLFYSMAWQHFTFLYTKGWQREPFELDHLRRNLEFYFRVINKYIIPLAFLSLITIFRLIRYKINPFACRVIKRSSLWLIPLVIFASIFLLLFIDQRQFRYISNLIALLLIIEAIVLADWMKSSRLLTSMVIAVILLSNFLNNPKLKFPLFNYFYEITHDYDGPNEGIVKYLSAHAQAKQTVKAPYGDIVLIFYTDLQIESPLEFNSETYPDWIILRRDWVSPGFYKGDYYKNIQRRYEKIVLDYPDIIWGNRPDPGYHQYRTAAKAPNIVIYKKKEK